MHHADGARPRAQRLERTPTDIVWARRTPAPATLDPRMDTLLGGAADRDDQSNVLSLEHVVPDGMSMSHDRGRRILGEPQQRLSVVLAEDGIDECIEEEV